MSATGRGAQRREADYYPTPAWCVHRFLEACELPDGSWLEPSAGDGQIIRAVDAHVPSNRSEPIRMPILSRPRWSAVEIRPECQPYLDAVADEVEIGDFLRGAGPRSADVVIGNPPFALAMEFIQESIWRARHVAFLLRLNFLGSAGRAPFHHKHPVDVYVLPNRPSFSGHGTDSIEYAWFHWDRERTREGRIRVLALTPDSEKRRGFAGAPVLDLGGA